MKFYSILFFICFLSANNFTFANEVKGNEFIATFLPNYHNNWNSEKSEEKYGDSVYIFIYAELKTQAVINYRNYTGSQFTDTIIIQANTIHTFKKRSYDFALRGYNLSGVISSRHNSERISNISFHLKTDNPVIVYGHSQAKTTSESFNILPYESLGKEHFVSSYNSSGWIES